jgi:hypothetical protein
VCEIVNVTLNGRIVDPNLYGVTDHSIVGLNGFKFPRCQNLAQRDASPLARFDATMGVRGTNDITIVAQQDGCFLITVENGFSGVLDRSEALEFVGDDGVSIVVPSAGLTVVSGTELLYCSNWIQQLNPANTTDPIWGYLDALVALDRNFIRTVSPKPHVEQNRLFIITNFGLNVRSYFKIDDSRCCTFEITYRTGCDIPLDVQAAVAELACEMAKARCGDESCRLPDRFKSFTLDGDRISSMDPYAYISVGLTGIEAVDRFIRAYNPRGLYRRARLLSADVRNHRLFKVR